MLTNKLKKEPKRLHNQSHFILVCSIVSFALSLSIRMFYAGQIIVKNKTLDELYKKKITLEKEVSFLSFEDSNLSSMSRVEEEAKKLGFIEMSDNFIALDPNAASTVAVLPTQ